MQKVRLYGRGSNFDSIFFHNDNEIRSLTTVKNDKKFNKIDVNNFVARKVEPGMNAFFLAYKSDFHLNKNQENNMIMTNTIEIPYLDSIITKKPVLN